MAELKTLVGFDEIQSFADLIVERFKPQKIILFGSYASGTPTSDSDLDLLVVMSVPPKREQAPLIRSELQRRFPAPLQIIFMKGEEFEETKDVVGGIAYPASHAGRVLYEQNP
jgi:predicted nucleotidyltransferase